MTKPRLVDLFCGAGGAARGYQMAGFHVTGVDLRPMPRYAGDEFIQADALTFPLEGYDAIHASPPCQAYTQLAKGEHPRLIEPVRDRLSASGVPWVIENVRGAPIRHDVTLCGTMFGLGIDGAELHRHRYFELSVPIHEMLPPCQHGISAATMTVAGTGSWLIRERRVIGVYGGHGRDRRRKFTTQCFTVQQRREAMGIDWMTGAELSQAIPPAYTEFVGRALLSAIHTREAVG